MDVLVKDLVVDIQAIGRPDDGEEQTIVCSAAHFVVTPEVAAFLSGLEAKCSTWSQHKPCTRRVMNVMRRVAVTSNAIQPQLANKLRSSVVLDDDEAGIRVRAINE